MNRRRGTVAPQRQTLREVAREAAAQAPPLSPEQQARIRALLAPSATKRPEVVSARG